MSLEGLRLVGGLSQGVAGRRVPHSFHQHPLDTYCVPVSGAELLMGGR